MGKISCDREAGLKISMFPWLEGQNILFLFLILYLESVTLFIYCKQKTLWATKNICIKHNNLSFPFVLFVSGSWDNLVLRVQNHSRLQHHVKNLFPLIIPCTSSSEAVVSFSQDLAQDFSH